MTNIPIFLASDNNYAPFVATTIASICNNTKSFIDFYILDSGINEDSKNKIKSIKDKFNNFEVEFITIDAEKEFKGFEISSYLTLATFNRFLIPQLKPNLGKVIYLDVDIIVLDDIKELYVQSMDNYALAAVKEQGDKNYVLKSKENLNILESNTYFNAGVLLMDLDKWRDNNILEKLFKIEKEFKGKLLCHDQDILNKYFENSYKLLDNKFNTMIKGDDIIVRHFASTIKPWNVPINEKFEQLNNLEDFKKYVRLLDIDISKYEIPILKLKLLDMWKNKKLEMVK